MPRLVASGFVPRPLYREFNDMTGLRIDLPNALKIDLNTFSFGAGTGAATAPSPCGQLLGILVSEVGEQLQTESAQSTLARLLVARAVPS